LDFQNIHIYSDFDGTITELDIGDHLFIDHGKFEPYHSQLIKDELNISDYWIKLCSSLEGKIDEMGVREYALAQETDPYFKGFAEYCKDQGFSLSVVSDGFDSYIKPILKELDLERLKVYCNKMVFEKDCKVRPVFPFASESCNCKCASCKRNSILSNTNSDSIIVFIGDGYSDFCAAEHSDIVFAKKHLAAYCNEKRIPHYPYKTFFDVKRIFSNIVEKKKIKIRHQAYLNRKRAFENE